MLLLGEGRNAAAGEPRCLLSIVCGCRVNGNLNLSRAIGDLKYKAHDLAPKDQIITAQPDVTRVSLTPEDKFFVLACDGVWDGMSNQVRACSIGRSAGAQIFVTTDVLPMHCCV